MEQRDAQTALLESCVTETSMLRKPEWKLHVIWGVYSLTSGQRDETETRTFAPWGNCVRVTYSGVFAQLAQRGEGFLVSFANFIDQLLQLSAQLVALREHHLLLHVLLLFVSVVTHRCMKGKRERKKK